MRWPPSLSYSTTSASGPSSRFLLADEETVRVFDVAIPTWQATINGASSNLGKIHDVALGYNPNEVLVFSDFGVKLTIWSLLTSRGVEIKDPKYMVMCYDHRPKTAHLALLTRASAQDVLILLKPGSHEVLKSVVLGTVDAQEVRWSTFGHWLAVRDVASAGHRLYIYTADGHHFRTYSGPGDTDQLGLGLKSLQWSPVGTLLLGDYDGTVTVLSKDIVSMPKVLHLLNTQLIQAKFSTIARLEHRAPVNLPNASLWEEQINANKERSYIPASQPGNPPTSASFAKSAAPNQGISLMVLNYDGSLLATRNDAVPTTAWIWSMQSGKAVAVMIHHSPIKQIAWHTTENDVLLMHCAIPEPAVHVWKSTWDIPRVIALPLEKANGKLEATWLQSCNGESYNILLAYQTQSAIAEISSTGDLIPVASNLDVPAELRDTGAEDLFDEGNSLDLSPIKIIGANGLRNTLHDSGSGFDMTEEGIDDTFHYRRHVKATG